MLGWGCHPLGAGGYGGVQAAGATCFGAGSGSETRHPGRQVRWRCYVTGGRNETLHSGGLAGWGVTLRNGVT